MIGLALWMKLLLVFCCRSRSVQCAYEMQHGYKVTSQADQLRTVSRPGMSNILCAVACQSTSDCDLYHYSTSSNECVLFRQKLAFQPRYHATLDPLWSLGYIRQHVRSYSWTLVFRAQSRLGISVYDTWMNSSHYDDRPYSDYFPKTCRNLYDIPTKLCDRYFRSWILDNWSGIRRVWFALANSSMVVNEITFDGTGSDMLSWFSQSRIVTSSWSPTIESDSLENYPAGNLEGSCDSLSCHRFAMHGVYQSCASDYFYTFVIDKADDSCSLDSGWQTIDLSTFPVFIHSPGPGRGALGSGKDASWAVAKEADVFSVWVQFY